MEMVGGIVMSMIRLVHCLPSGRGDGDAQCTALINSRKL
jgi:hypothetical protein